MSHVESDPASDSMADTGQGVGARLLRKEDDRFMRGRGQYVADIRLAGLQDVAFVRSPLAHARIRAIHVPERYRDVVFTAADLTGVKPIRAVSGLPGFKISEQPVLATGKVRHVGELVAMCLAPTRAEAEDIAAAVTLDLEELPAVHDMRKARDGDTALVHEHWGDNVFLESAFEVDIAPACPIAWASNKARSGLSRRTSAADLVTRESCCPKKSALPGLRCAKAAPSAGSRIGASI